MEVTLLQLQQAAKILRIPYSKATKDELKKKIERKLLYAKTKKVRIQGRSTNGKSFRKTRAPPLRDHRRSFTYSNSSARSTKSAKSNQSRTESSRKKGILQRGVAKKTGNRYTYHGATETTLPKELDLVKVKNTLDIFHRKGYTKVVSSLHSKKAGETWIMFRKPHTGGKMRGMVLLQKDAAPKVSFGGSDLPDSAYVNAKLNAGFVKNSAVRRMINRYFKG